MLTGLLGKRPSAQRGFTLIELVIAIAVLAIIIMLGAPTLSVWMQNNQIKAAGSSILSGLQTARTEAIRRNARVSFVLSNPAVIGQSGWCISLNNDDPAPCMDNDPAPLQSSATEGAATVIATPTPAGAASVTFDGLGRRIANPNGTDVITQIDIGSSALVAGDSIDLRIMIDAGGVARLCVPDLGDGAPIPPAGDPRRC